MKVTFFTGAGISKSSGLPTFREAEGLWANFDPQTVCSKEAYSKDRKKVLDFHNDLAKAIAAAEPTPAHRAIAAFEEFADVTIVTQNIDDLHERAGSTKVVKIHGDIFTAKLKRYKSPTLRWTEDILPQSHPEGSPSCAGTMRHDVVFFGESPKYTKEAILAIRRCDYLVVVGTSLKVYPAADFVFGAPAWLGKIYVDPEPDGNLEPYFDKISANPADLGVVDVINWLKRLEKN